MCLLRINLPNLCPNMNNFDAVDFSECHSEEVMFLLTLSVYIYIYIYIMYIYIYKRNDKSPTIQHGGVSCLGGDI